MASKPPRQQARPDPQSHVVTSSQQWSGPLPPPAALVQFNTIIPNGAERIMGMVEREQEHGLAQEDTVLRATVGDTARGHWMGLVISIAAIAAAGATAYFGAHPTVSIALVGLPIVAIVRSIMANKSNAP